MQGRIETSTNENLDSVPAICRVSIETERDGRRTCVTVDCPAVEDAGWLLLSLGLDEVLTGHRQLESGDVRGWWNREDGQQQVSSGNGNGHVDIPAKAVERIGAGNGEGKRGGKRERVWSVLAAGGRAGRRTIDVATELGLPRSNVASHIKGLVDQDRAERVKEGVYRALGGGGSAE